MMKLIFLLLAIGCNNVKYDKDACNILSMKRYKGVPNLKHLFDENCEDVEIKYTAEVCQKALESLMMSGSLEKTKKKFSPPIIHCFSESDLKNFSKEQ